jgi:hypothetical protein
MIHHFQNTFSWLRVLLPKDYPKNQIIINFLYEHVWQLCTKTLKINSGFYKTYIIIIF